MTNIVQGVMQLKDIHKKYYADMHDDVFWQIVQADPTYDAEGHPGKKGKYTQWLLNAYKKGVIGTDALNECCFLLDVFHRYRQLLDERDIMKYDTLQKLRDALDPYLDDPYADVHETSKAMRIRKIKEGAEKVYEDEQWAVFVPHTWEASRYYGKGTRWCTAYDYDDYYFNQYNSKGPLYININRQTKEKWQFHFETQTYCNERDERVSLDDVPLTDGLRQFYHLTVAKPIRPASVHTFADAINQWRADGCVGPLQLRVLEGDTSCVETLVLPPSYSDYSEMFQSCHTITTLDLSRWNVSCARNMESMFFYCENLITLRLDGWDMRGVQRLAGMFAYCDALNTLSLDYCHFPDTTSVQNIFICCRDLRVINMHYCDMQSVRFVLREVVSSHLYENVTIHLTPDTEERYAYDGLASLIRQTEEAMQLYREVKEDRDASITISHIEEMLDADSRLRSNPLYFEQLSSGINVQIQYSLNRLNNILLSKAEMTYTSRRRGLLMLTRPDVKQYEERVEWRYRQAQALLPLLDRVAKQIPQCAQLADALVQRISEMPSASQTDTNLELRQLGLSNRWHVTIPALSRFMDRLTNNTRKGVEHLRYTAKERAGFILALLVTILSFSFIAFVAAAKRGGEYWVMGIFAYALVRGIFSVDRETLKQKRELKALGWIILSMVLYLLLIVHVIRPIYRHYKEEQSLQTERYDEHTILQRQMAVTDIDEDRPDVQPLIIGTDTLSEMDVHLALSDHVPFSNHRLPDGHTVAQWCISAMRKDYMQRHPDADSYKVTIVESVIVDVMRDKSEKELRADVSFNLFSFYMDIAPE